MDLCLGTVQFGMDYGIQGGNKLTKTEIFKILDFARENHITVLDTAAGYGDAQAVIGKYIVNHPHSFEIISKLSMDLFNNLTNTRDYISAAYHDAETTLQQLFLPYLKGMLFHNPRCLYDKNAVAALKQLKQSGYTELIGASVYEPSEAEAALALGLDIIQLPANLFDHRFDDFIQRAGKSVKLYARSIYLQGLLLMDIDEAKAKFPTAVEYIIKLDRLCQDNNLSRRDLAFTYIKKKTGISAVVFGVDNHDQLKENMEAFRAEIPEEVVTKLAGQFKNISDSILSPVKWNSKKAEEVSVMRKKQRRNEGKYE